jgi:hypothetical protein
MNYSLIGVRVLWVGLIPCIFVVSVKFETGGRTEMRRGDGYLSSRRRRAIHSVSDSVVVLANDKIDHVVMHSL